MIDTMIFSNYTHKEDIVEEVTEWIDEENIEVISVSYVFEPDKMSGWHAFITYRVKEETDEKVTR